MERFCMEEVRVLEADDLLGSLRCFREFVMGLAAIPWLDKVLG
jgi:hypothetical protein